MMFKSTDGTWPRRHLLRSLVLSLLAGLIFLLFPAPAFADILTEPLIPTTAIEWDQQAARVPDWSRISFRTLPSVVSDGAFDAPPEASQAAGYDLSRSWKVGQTPDRYLKLGDFQTSLYPQIFNLHTIAATDGFDLRQVALSSLEMITWQTVSDLVTAIPGLSNLQVSQVDPIAQLFSQSTLGSNFSDSIGAVLSSFPSIRRAAAWRFGRAAQQLFYYRYSRIRKCPTSKYE